MMWWKRRTWAWMTLAIQAEVLAVGTVAAAAPGTQVLEDLKGDHLTSRP